MLRFLRIVESAVEAQFVINTTLRTVAGRNKKNEIYSGGDMTIERAQDRSALSDTLRFLGLPIVSQ